MNSHVWDIARGSKRAGAHVELQVCVKIRMLLQVSQAIDGGDASFTWVSQFLQENHLKITRSTASDRTMTQFQLERELGQQHAAQVMAWAASQNLVETDQLGVERPAYVLSMRCFAQRIGAT